MDGLAALLDGPRARGVFLLRCLMDPPWSIRLEDEAPLSLIAVTHGSAWVVPDEGERFAVSRGDVVVALGPGHWTMADDPATPTTVRILPGEVCLTPDGRHLDVEMDRVSGAGATAGRGRPGCSPGPTCWRER